eukprot:gnl/MRDRNA2_/MRDRNA2_36475_c0_seq1.p1 gnl/MRDRNA2_/MRDRNA2_36475_c0~~gnl/MRDRNA2_/MRDRNA2_36475_c0_seq1.p1  ORF type:complete len:207 (-),score=27.44 gnl/MRDRNA2_/MRDRNA2_36475_c0_seq1:145-672(-)
MVLPMPAMPQQMGPPSEYAKNQKCPYSFFLVVATLLVLARLAIMLDILGGFIAAITVGLGWYAVSKDMDVQWVCYAGMMSLIQCVFGAVKAIDIGVHDLETLKIPFALVMYVGAPVVMLIIALMSYGLYKDYQSCNVESGSGGGQAYGERVPLGANRETPGFTPFQGSGQRLGGP